MEAEVNGTLDILRACVKAKTIKRVIYASSISAASPLNDKGEFGDCIDESCWSNADIFKRKGPLFWVSSMFDFLFFFFFLMMNLTKVIKTVSSIVLLLNILTVVYILLFELINEIF